MYQPKFTTTQLVVAMSICIAPLLTLLLNLLLCLSVLYSLQEAHIATRLSASNGTRPICIFLRLTIQIWIRAVIQ
jgi:hypothetical protein